MPTLWLQEKSFLKERSNEQKPWIKGNVIFTGKRSIENKLFELYHSKFSGIYDLHKKSKAHRFIISKTKIREMLQSPNSYYSHHPDYDTFKRRRV